MHIVISRCDKKPCGSQQWTWGIMGGEGGREGKKAGKRTLLLRSNFPCPRSHTRPNRSKLLWRVPGSLPDTLDHIIPHPVFTWAAAELHPVKAGDTSNMGRFSGLSYWHLMGALQHTTKPRSSPKLDQVFVSSAKPRTLSPTSAAFSQGYFKPKELNTQQGA